VAEISNEPNMSQIEDYNNKESAEKRKTVKIVIISGLIISVIYGFAYNYFNSVEDQLITESTFIGK